MTIKIDKIKYENKQAIKKQESLHKKNHFAMIQEQKRNFFMQMSNKKIYHKKFLGQ